MAENSEDLTSKISALENSAKTLERQNERLIDALTRIIHTPVGDAANRVRHTANLVAAGFAARGWW